MAVTVVNFLPHLSNAKKSSPIQSFTRKVWPSISILKSDPEHSFQTTTPIDSISYVQASPEKSSLNEALGTKKTNVVNKLQHIIHKAISWEKMLEGGGVESLSEIAEKRRPHPGKSYTDHESSEVIL